MIFYLSCTGNTRWAAEQLAAVTNDRLVFIPDAVKGDCTFHLREGERVGFCLPVHGWRVQPMVREFIEKLTIGERKHETLYTYFLVTCGDNCGEYTDQLEGLLNAKGFDVKTCCSVIMPESYVGLPFMDVDPDLREAEKKMNANGVLQKFSEILVDRRNIRMPIERGATPRLYSRVLGTFFYKYLITDKRFKVDLDKCIGCGNCVKHCPVGNMQLVGMLNNDKPSSEGMMKARPEWLHNGRCLTCMACYHYCPENAISFWHFTKGKGQYYFEHNRTQKKTKD